ncbi:hypothetical protein QP952_00120 [Corynebacterium pseudodiphtheriticum]|uniref:hypothetical protein n=1 Tax=Corynebacterium pseudodiphtheriticum TaxID=37637 RepID=UPI00254E396E|nr:hypothetical protein [Corynebacterium pseudodiphtheriticum]MDK8708086.1 hypothetical protein [Corynebacterium pseudodiphtheriticum]
MKTSKNDKKTTNGSRVWNIISVGGSSISLIIAALSLGASWSSQNYIEELDSVRKYQVAVREVLSSSNGSETHDLKLEVFNGTDYVMTQIKPLVPAVSGLLSSGQIGSLGPGQKTTLNLRFSADAWEKIHNCNLGIIFTTPTSDDGFSESRKVFETTEPPFEQKPGDVCFVENFRPADTFNQLD